HDRRRKVRLEIAEELERRGRAELLTHEQQRQLRRQEENRREAAHHPRRRERRHPLTESSIAHLIVILQKAHEGGRRQRDARFAAPAAVAELRRLALIVETVGETADEMRQRAR